MTTADLLAADFQLRSSNILVAPLDAAGVYPRGDLVVYRAGARAELFGCNALFTLATEQHDLVPDLDIFVRPEDTSIHRDPPQQRAPLVPDQGLSLSRKRPPIPLRVPYRHGCGAHRRPGMPEGGSRIRRVHENAAEGLRGEDGLEAFDLASRRPLV